jgi:hypothetical protein
LIVPRCVNIANPSAGEAFARCFWIKAAFRVVLALTLTLCAVRFSPADAAQALDQTARSPQPSVPVTLTVRFADGRSQFRPGESLPIELEFDSRVPKRFVVDRGTYDRGGRLTTDEFQVEPDEAVTDPLLDYFAFGGGSLGGMRGIGVLGEKPFTVKLDLNEWFRFEKAGIYTLAVRSQRVSDDAKGTTTLQSVVPVESNTVSFEILPRDLDWEATEFEVALQILNSKTSGVDRRKGCRMLRFLGTDVAVDEMIKHYDEGQWGCDFEYMAGLFTAPDRGRVVRQLEAGLRANDQPVSEGSRHASLETLGMLPDRQLPELDDVLAAGVDTNEGLDVLSIRAELLQRYASPAVSARVLSRVDDLLTRMACRPQAALLAYFVRADANLGKTLLSRALASREMTGCYKMALRDVATLRMTPAVEAVAADHLDDPDPQVVISAVETLGRYGSRASKQPLSVQFERWHRTWEGRQEELRYSHAESHPHAIQGMVELTFLQALGQGQAWLTDKGDLLELRALCVTDNCRTQADHMISTAGDTRITILRVESPDNSARPAVAIPTDLDLCAGAETDAISKGDQVYSQCEPPGSSDCARHRGRTDEVRGRARHRDAALSRAVVKRLDD